MYSLYDHLHLDRFDLQQHSRMLYKHNCGDYYVLLTQEPGAKQPLPTDSRIPSREMMELGDLLAQAAELSQTLNTSVDRVAAAMNRILSDENIAHVLQPRHHIGDRIGQEQEPVRILQCGRRLEGAQVVETPQEVDGHVQDGDAKNNRGRPSERPLGDEFKAQ